jgi:hypothetical protein
VRKVGLYILKGKKILLTPIIGLQWRKQCRTCTIAREYWQRLQRLWRHTKGKGTSRGVARYDSSFQGGGNKYFLKNIIINYKIIKIPILIVQIQNRTHQR